MKIYLFILIYSFNLNFKLKFKLILYNFSPSSLIPGDAKAKDSADLNTPLNKLDSDKKLEIWRRNHWY